MTEHKDKLPPRYKSWLELWDTCKNHINQHNAIYLTFDEVDSRYETTTDFIKARCFEEFNLAYQQMVKEIEHPNGYHPTVHEVNSILNGKSYFLYLIKQHEPTNN